MCRCATRGSRGQTGFSFPRRGDVSFPGSRFIGDAGRLSSFAIVCKAMKMSRCMLSWCKGGVSCAFSRIVLTVMAVLIITSGLSYGSLGQGHLYVAEKLLAKMPPQLGKLIDIEKNAYLAGANGVDIVYWGYFTDFRNNLSMAPPADGIRSAYGSAQISRREYRCRKS